MILISISPFTLRRLVLLLLSAIGFASTCFGESILLSVRSTPYDNQMTRIRSVLTSDAHAPHGDVSLRMVNHWIGDLRSIPYGFSTEWKTPAETQSSPAADCKAKAVALYETMQEHGATNVRLVIGKRTAASSSTHAWLQWDTRDGSYVLDPTINWMAYRSSDIGQRSYIPLYAFAGPRKFRAISETLVAQN
jgi:predicted transglutaminase-like cysteine proteinase